MCDIKKETKYKSRIVYKVCYKIDDQYYSYFAGMLIKEGKVETRTQSPHKYLLLTIPELGITDYHQGENLFNKNLVGRTSGFASLDIAEQFILRLKLQNINFYKLRYLKPRVVLLKVKIGGSIFKGSTKNISFYTPSDGVTYAGSEILSFEEIL